MNKPSRNDQPTGTAAAGEPHVVRSFVTHAQASSGPEPTTDEPMVRAYTMTGGRTRPQVILSFETIVSLVEPGPGKEFYFEKAAILDLCAVTPQSVAELAAHMSVPIGTARVLAGDLVEDEALEAHLPKTNASKDVALLRRLIVGVSSL